ncbi:hypothetical protein Q5762_01365 [Streptomyces sp. P9(2023)]|uniref:hypothetical protein n=1 Tax=Streptomyces sp. P9(2023) TaxID=3064394 RepID=UPI0028F3FA1B|nr:hypothetical protein [Streptomyces sp. P9(2023)]MDT9687017.1 hypothetical protein [Streptomyces sp. P9(2023)]
MTPYPFTSNRAEDDGDRIAGPAPTPSPQFVVPPAPSTPPPAAVWPAPPGHERAAGTPETPAAAKTPAEAETPAPPAEAETPAPPAEAETPAPPAEADTPAAPAAADTADASEQADRSETGDEAIHTLLSTAATERPVEEVASLVARLQATGELSSPADVALRAAAVTRPLDEVRQLVALLNESGYDLHQAETTLRAAAVGRPIEDVVALVNILGTDGSDWRSAGADAEERKAGRGKDDGERVGSDAAASKASKRPEGSAKWPRSALDGALAAGPGSHTASSALRSVFRWPAAVALLVCGLVHVPTDLADLRAGGQAETLSVVVTVLCLLCGVWLAVRDTMIVWAAATGLAVGVIVLHALESGGMVHLLNSGLAFTYTWAKAAALLSAVAVVMLAGSTVVRSARAAGAADSA